MTAKLWLRDLVTTPGAHSYPQLQLADRLRKQVADLPAPSAIRKGIGLVYEHSDIVERHMEVSLEEIDARRDWYRMVNGAAESLGRRTLERLFARGAVLPSECDAFVVVSSSHAGFPSLSRLLQEEVGLPLSASAWDLGGLGCAGPTQGLQFATMLLEQGRCRNVLLLCVDVMGTQGEARRHPQMPDMSQMVAHCLASDGAAALVLGREPSARTRLGFERCALGTQLWSKALDQNDFGACEANEPFLSVGKDIRTRLLEETAPFFDDLGPNDTLLMHPGGAALMKKVAESHPRHRETVALSSAVLRENGNIGSPSVLWVLDRALKNNLSFTDNLVLFALGPGIVTTLARLTGVSGP